MGLLKRLLGYLGDFKAKIVLVVFANLFYAFFSIFTLAMIVPFLSVLFGQAGPVVIKPSFSLTSHFFIDTFYYYMGLVVGQYGRFAAIVFIAAAMVVFSLLSNVFRYSGLFWLSAIRAGVLKSLRAGFYGRLLVLPLSFYARRRKGDILSRIGADVQEVEWSVFASLQSLCRDPLLVAVFLATLFSISLKLTAVSLAVLPIVVCLTAAVGSSIKRNSLTAQQLLGRMSAFFEEAVGGLRVIKAYNAEKHMSDKFRHENLRFRRLNKKIFRINELGAPLVELLCIAALLAIAVTGLALFPAEAQVRGPVLALYFIVFARIIPPAKQMASTVYTLQKGLAAAGRVFEVMDADEQIEECARPLPIHELKDCIECRDVSFSYCLDDDGRPDDVLKHVSFRLPKGKTVALVGPSGSGKSTIADLLPRFYDARSGEVTVDGIPVRQYKISDLRGLFGRVDQDTVLFNDTVYNNIVFGMPGATEEQVVAAAKVAQAHDFIMEMENGYDTLVGDRGMRLSGGQRQRLSIARAILRNPQVLILDEATSALDTEAEHLFQEALLPLLKERTGLIIAHRLSTVRFADQILFVKDGQIAECGTHDELMKKQGAYRKFCEAQKL